MLSQNSFDPVVSSLFLGVIVCIDGLFDDRLSIKDLPVTEGVILTLSAPETVSARV